ncbi:MAG: alpha/beta hydrolase, partial [Gammaproteobacteria bacterium]
DFYRHIKNSELAVLPDCGHNAYEQQPEAYTKHLLDFINKHSVLSK